MAALDWLTNMFYYGCKQRDMYPRLHEGRIGIRWSVNDLGWTADAILKHIVLFKGS